MNTFLIILAIIVICIIIIIITVILILHNKTGTSIQPNIQPNIQPIQLVLNEEYIIMQNTVVKDYIYYRFGAKTESEVNNTLRIQSIINGIIQIIKEDDIKYNLQHNKPIFLIGPSARDFDEFQSLRDLKTIEGTRNILDIPAFSTNKPLPGYISNIFNVCNNSTNEDIVFHEFMHVIESDGMSQNQKDVLNELYKKYNVPSNNYNINSYAFVSVHEFFAEMAQVYCKMTLRLDVTGGVTINILRQYLPDLNTFLESIFNISSNYVLNAICYNCNKNLLC